MKVKFIKDHPVGIAKGTEADVAPRDAQRWEEQGFVEIIGKEAAKVSNKMIEPEDNKKKESSKKQKGSDEEQ